jgi:hypothetical protein
MLCSGRLGKKRKFVTEGIKEGQAMKRNWVLKAIVFLLGVGLILYGVSEMQSDPTLRVLQQMSISQIEKGELPRQGQYVEIKDAYLLPVWVVNSRKSRKRGERAYVHVPVGSQATQQKMMEDQPGKSVLWIELSQDFGTAESANAAMQADEQYRRPYPVQGVVRELEHSIHEEGKQIRDLQLADTVLSIDIGSTPTSFGAGAGCLMAGALALLLLAGWLFSDHVSEKWMQTLRRPDVSVFAGKSPLLILTMVAGPVGMVLGGVAMNIWFEERTLSLPLVLGALAAVAVAGVGLWRNRVAVVLAPEKLYVFHGDKRTSLPLAEVDGLTLNERKVKGVLVAKYTLHHAGKTTAVGNSLFACGLDDAAPFGLAIRDAVLQRLAPVLLDKLNSGQPLSFGPFTVGLQGLSKGSNASGDVLAWSDVESAALKNGQLKIKQKGKMFAWGTYAVSKLRNLDVLLHILQAKGL